jgi:hypothetical protein
MPRLPTTIGALTLAGAAALVAGVAFRGGGTPVDGDSAEGSRPGGADADASSANLSARRREAARETAEATGLRAVGGTVRRDGAPAAAAVRVWSLPDEGEGLQADAWPEPWLARLLEPDAVPPDASVAAGEDGRWRAEGLRDGLVLAVATDARGAWAAARGRADAEEPAEIALELSGGPESLSVRAVHDDGSPFRGWLLLHAFVPGESAATGTPSVAPLRTDADGLAAWRGLPRARVRLVAVAPPTFRSAPAELLLPRPGTWTLVVDGPSREVSGRVLSRAGAPVAGAAVVVEAEDAPPAAEAHAVTDAGGRFVARATKRDARVRATARGFVPGFALLPAAAEGPVEVRLSGGARVVGTVREAAGGKAVPGVPVVLAEAMERWGHGAARRAVADANGRFAFEGVKPGHAMAVALGNGKASERLAETTSEGFNPCLVHVGPDESSEVDLVVEPAAALRGRVVAPDGSGVAGAVVSVELPGGPLGGCCSYDEELSPHWLAFLPQPGERTTDASGRFEADGLVPDMTYEVTVRAKGFAPVSVTTRAGSGRTAEVTLSPKPVAGGPRVAFLVRVEEAGTGAPVPGAKVTLRSADAGEPSREGATDAAGLARFEGVPAGDVDVTASGAGHGYERGTWPADRGEARLRVRAWRTVSGRVTFDDGRPAAGASVVPRSTGREGWFGQTPTDADGLYRIEIPPSGFEMHATLDVDGAPWSAEVVVPPGDAQVDLRLARGPVAEPDASLRVVDATGAPVASADVLLWREDGGWPHLYLHDGRAAIPSFASDARVEVYAAVSRGGEPLGALMAGPFRSADALDGLELRLPAERTIAGRVVEAGGAGVAGVRVEARPERTGKAAADGWLYPHAVASTGPDGAFRVPGLADAPYRLTLRASGRHLVGQAVPARGGDAAVIVTLAPAARPEIRVVDPEGRAVVGAIVNASRPEDESPRRRGFAFPPRTDGEGRVRLEGLDPAGEYSLHVDPPDGAGLLFAEQEGWRPRDARVVLPRTVVLEGTLRDANGAPLVAEVQAVRRGAELWRGTLAWGSADAAGRFRLEGLPAGDVDVLVTLNRWAAPIRVEARAPDPAANLVVDAGPRLEIALAPAPGEAADLHLAGPGGQILERTVPAGSPWVVRGLPAATYAVYARLASRRLVAHAQGVAHDGGRVVLETVPARTVTGRLRFPDGADEFGRAYVEVKGPGFEQHAAVGDDGSFRVDALPPGTWRLEADAWCGDTAYSAVVEVAAGSTGLEVVLAKR